MLNFFLILAESIFGFWEICSAWHYIWNSLYITYAQWLQLNKIETDVCLSIYHFYASRVQCLIIFMHKPILGKFSKGIQGKLCILQIELRIIKVQYISKLIEVNQIKIIYTYISLLKAQEIQKCIGYSLVNPSMRTHELEGQFRTTVYFLNRFLTLSAT